MKLARDDFVCVHPIGETVLRWPPKDGFARGLCVRSLTYFVPVYIDDDRRMTDDEAFVVERFPTDRTMTAVMPVPGGGVGYHVGTYGSFWPTDPAVRDQCYRGEYVNLGGLDG
ncbi:MAG TPA: hypothetical protein VKZ65_09530, partial [Glycomyces sp.]|nr:hypothetical protein [Glycomyces sp.]